MNTIINRKPGAAEGLSQLPCLVQLNLIPFGAVCLGTNQIRLQPVRFVGVINC